MKRHDRLHRQHNARFVLTNQSHLNALPRAALPKRSSRISAQSRRNAQLPYPRWRSTTLAHSWPSEEAKASGTQFFCDGRAYVSQYIFGALGKAYLLAIPLPTLCYLAACSIYESKGWSLVKSFDAQSVTGVGFGKAAATVVAGSGDGVVKVYSAESL